jgi:hypothetical protein
VDLLGEHFTECSTKDGEVLTEDEHLSPVDGAPTGDHTVGVRAFLETGGMCTMSGEQIKFVKAAWVKQRIEPFTRQHLAFLMLSLDRPWRACVSGFVFA